MQISLPGKPLRGVPPLPVGFGYLVLIDQELSVTETFPVLSQLIYDTLLFDNNMNWDEKKSLNRILLYIQEEPGAMAEFTLDSQAKVSGSEKSDDFIIKRINSTPEGKKVFPISKNFLVHTLGDYSSSEDKEVKKNFTTYPVAGVQPFKIKRFIEEILDSVNDDSANEYANLIFLDSISNISRSIGSKNTALFIRDLFTDTCWLPDFLRKENEGKLASNPTILIATVYEESLATDDMNYIKSMFDGVITFGVDTENTQEVYYSFDRFPLMDGEAIQKEEELYPIFGKRYFYKPQTGKTLDITAEEEKKVDPHMEVDHADT